MHKVLVLSGQSVTPSAVSSYSQYFFFLKNAKKTKKRMSGAVPASKKLIQSFQVTFTYFYAVAPAPYNFLSSAFSSGVNWTLKT